MAGPTRQQRVTELGEIQETSDEVSLAAAEDKGESAQSDVNMLMRIRVRN